MGEFMIRSLLLVVIIIAIVAIIKVRGLDLRPSFTMRTFFAIVTMIGVAMGWAAYQLRWIRQRHEFLAEKQVGTTINVWPGYSLPRKPPWSLRLFGERSPVAFTVQKQDKAEAEALFPEASILVLDIGGGQEIVHSGQEVDEHTDSNDASHPLPGGGF